MDKHVAIWIDRPVNTIDFNKGSPMSSTCKAVTVCLLLMTLTIIGCKSPSTTDQASLSQLETSVFYRERIKLPPGSTVTVTLEDVSRMDTAATIIAKKTLTPETGPPYKVALRYAPDQIKEHMRYAVRARIEFNGKLLFINDTHIDPFAVPAGKPVDILVKRVR